MDSLNSHQFTPVVKLVTASIDDVIAVYLFGSRAADSVHESSDIDLAVLPAEPIPIGVRWDLQQELAMTLHSDVDLVDLRSASTVMRFQIVTKGEVLYESDPTRRAEFEMTSLSMYARFNLERREILEQIRQEGRVYGG